MRRVGLAVLAAIVTTGCSGTAATTPISAPSSAAPALPIGSIYVANTTMSGLLPSLDVYAANPAGSISESPLASITGTATGLGQPATLAVDSLGRIYTTNSQTVTSITVYAPNPAGTVNERPIATITGTNTMLKDPAGIAVDASGKIYVTNTPLGGTFAQDDSVTIYAANPNGTMNAAPIGTIAGASTGLHGPSGIAVDASGNIYVANSLNGLSALDNSITVYPANPSGLVTESPAATITGTATGLDRPQGVAVDATGKIYVANGLSSSITVYAPNPSGTIDEAPLATIAGPNTGLSGPDGIALDASGNIYVTNDVNANTITVYAANPAGTLDEAPLATIAGSNTGQTARTGIAVH
jgi:sugar lactone lactonase YvrE